MKCSLKGPMVRALASFLAVLLAVILAFSVGLAAVLIAIGLFMVHARHFISRFHADTRLISRWLPLTSSAFIFLFGVALTLQALQAAGLLLPVDL